MYKSKITKENKPPVDRHKKRKIKKNELNEKEDDVPFCIIE